MSTLSYPSLKANVASPLRRSGQVPEKTAFVVVGITMTGGTSTITTMLQVIERYRSVEFLLLGDRGDDPAPTAGGSLRRLSHRSDRRLTDIKIVEEPAGASELAAAKKVHDCRLDRLRTSRCPRSQRGHRRGTAHHFLRSDAAQPEPEARREARGSSASFVPDRVVVAAVGSSPP